MSRGEIERRRGGSKALDVALAVGGSVVVVLVVLAFVHAIVGLVGLAFKFLLIVAVVALVVRVFAGRKR